MGFLSQPLLDDGQQTDYAGQLTALSDEDFINEIASQIYHAGFSSRVTVADQKAGIGYKEAERREKPWLYAKAYNSAACSAGVSLDAGDYERAQAPVAEAA